MSWTPTEPAGSVAANVWTNWLTVDSAPTRDEVLLEVVAPPDSSD